jgi:hypothetical protein
VIGVNKKYIIISYLFLLGEGGGHIYGTYTKSRPWEQELEEF